MPRPAILDCPANKNKSYVVISPPSVIVFFKWSIALKVLIHKCKKIVKVIHLRVRFNLDVNGVKNSYKGSKVWYYKSGFEDFNFRREILCIQRNH